MSKKEIEDAIERMKEKNGELSKEELMHLMSKGDLTEEEMKKLAQENGVQLNKEDIETIEKV